MNAELVVRAQRGDEISYGELAAASADRLFAVAYRILRDRRLAEDATHAVLVHLWQNLPTLRDARGFDGWSYGMLVRACELEARRAQRRLADGWWQAAAAACGSGDPACAADGGELQRAFAELTVLQRAVVVLHHYLELSAEEVAAALGIGVQGVRQRMDEARLALLAATRPLSEPREDPREAG